MYSLLPVLLLPFFLAPTSSQPSLRPRNTNSRKPTSSLSLPSFLNVLPLLPFAPLYSLKFGGPCIADIDSDGHYDLILTHHNHNWSRIYFGSSSSSFQVLTFPISGLPFRTQTLDVHGVSVGPISTRTRSRLVVFSVGGSKGTKLRPPEIYEIGPARVARDVTARLGFGQVKSRPRAALFLDLARDTNAKRRKLGGGPDLLLSNFLLTPKNLSQFAYRNLGDGQWAVEKDLGDFGEQKRGSTELVDVDGDGAMEVVSIQEMRFYKVGKLPFDLKEITKSVRPKGKSIERLSVTSIVEVDFDNDGRWDIYVGRARRLIGLEKNFDGVDDLLLRNVGGKYVDVSEEYGALKETNSVGVSCGDFNNDGWVDFLVVLYGGNDVVLMNLEGKGLRRIDGVVEKTPGEIGNNGIAVDMDLDGAVDIVVGYGGVRKPDFGRYLLMRNTLTVGSEVGRGWLLVTVYNDPTGAATSLHAVVTVFLGGGMKMMRRVGSRGAQAGGGSYLDTLHFGVGAVKAVKVRCRWTSGLVRVVEAVDVDQVIYFGVQAE